MNALVVQNPCHKCDSVTDNNITADNNYNYYNEIICVCVTTYAPSPTSIRLEGQLSNYDAKKNNKKKTNSFMASTREMG